MAHMKQAVLRYLIVAGAAFLLIGCGEEPYRVKDFQIVPLMDQAKTVTLADFKGKTVLLDFWATTCGPCKESMPEIQELWDKYHAKGFEVASISDEPRNLVLSFHEQSPYTFPVFMDHAHTANLAYNVDAIPQFVLIKDGRVFWSQVGFQKGDITREVESVMEG